MGCCGKAKNIVKGKVGGVIKRSTGISVMESPHTEARIEICRGCDENTWMKKSEYAAWLLVNGIKIFRNFAQLEKLPKLPKQNTGRNIYCRICKCFIPDKARVDAEKCSLDRWDH